MTGNKIDYNKHISVPNSANMFKLFMKSMII